MSTRTPAQYSRMGAISLLVLLVAMAAAFNLQKFPGFSGTTYHADLTDAGGLHKGCIVQIAGIRVGRVDNLAIEGDHVRVDFNVKDAEFGPGSIASVEVLNLLGEKYLKIQPHGPGTMPDDGTIPVNHTDVAFDIVGTLSTLTNKTETIDTPRLSRALSTVGDTLRAASPEIRQSFTGISRLSRTIYSRDAQIGELLHRAHRVTRLLAARRGDIVTLMRSANLLFAEVQSRRQAIRTLLVNTQRLSTALRGVATDNQRQIGPAMAQLAGVEKFLNSKLGQIRTVVHRLAPYTNILGNIIGTGPWFDDYVVNLGNIATGEFKPGVSP